MAQTLRLDDETRSSAAQHRDRLTDPPRLARLYASGLLNGTLVPLLDRLARIATMLMNAPISLVSLVDDLGVHHPGLAGVDEWVVARRGTPMAYSLCRHVVSRDQALVISDVRDVPSMSASLAVSEWGIVSYAGVPIRTADGHTAGVFCLMDVSRRPWSPQQVLAIEGLAAAAAAELDARTGVARSARDGRGVRILEHDPLTGVLSRHGLSNALREQITLAQARGAPFSLVAVDVDYVAAINERLGAAAGDAALATAATILSSAVRDTDRIGRPGNDEFLVVLAGADREEARAFVRRTSLLFAEHRQRTPSTIPLSVSMGVSSWMPGTPVSVGDLLQEAEIARYHARRAKPGEPG